MNVATLVSTVSEKDKNKMNKFIKELDGKIVDEFSMDCTHLTMPQLTITIKALQALINGIPIVTPDYWKSLYYSLKGHQKKLIDPNDFIPKQAEIFLRSSKLNFNANPKRKTIFNNKIFIFTLQQHMEHFRSVIEMAGGTCKHLGIQIKKTELKLKDTIIVQYIPSGSSSTQSQNASQGQDDCEKVYQLVKEIGKRLIADCEIGLAIIHCSIDKYCNPYVPMVTLENAEESKLKIKESKILVEDTPIESQMKNMKISSNVVIPDSEIQPNITRTRIAHKRKGEELEDENLFAFTKKSKPIELISQEQPTEAGTSITNLFAFKKPNNKQIKNLTQTSTQNLLNFKPTQSKSTKQAAKQIDVKPNPYVPMVTLENAEESKLLVEDIPIESQMKNMKISSNVVIPDSEKILTETESHSSNNLIEIDEVLSDGTDDDDDDPIDSNENQFQQTQKLTYTVQPVRSVNKWLTRLPSTNIKKEKADNDDEIDVKSNEKKLWIESIKNCFQVSNCISVKINQSIDSNSIDSSSLSNSINNDQKNNNGNGKNFKTFVKQKFIKQTRVIKSIVID